MALRIYLDNYEVPFNEHSAIEDVAITLRHRDEEGEIAYGFSGSVEFFGKAYEIIKNKLITNPGYFNQSVKVHVLDDCCKNAKLFEGKITYSQIDWCERSCSVKASIVQDDQTSKVYDCLKRKFIWESPEYETWYNNNVRNNPNFQYEAQKIADEKKDQRYATESYARIVADILVQRNILPPPPPNQFFEKQHPFVRYCIETRPNSLLHVAAVISVLLQLIISIVQTITAVIGFVVPAYFRFLRNLYDSLSRWAIDCEHGHVSPTVREYLENGCNACGLTFSSPIFQDPTSPYYNTLLFHAANDGGTLYNPGEIPAFNMVNRPLYSVYQFLEMLKSTFNAEYRIISNTLVFNRRDLILPPIMWKDFSDPNHPDVVEICYEYNKEQLPAYAKFEFTRDAFCDISNEGWRFTDDIVDYNPNNSFPWLKGSKNYRIPFGKFRFRDDNVNSDPISFWRDSPVSNFFFPDDDSYENLLLLSNGKCSEPKLLVWDGQDLLNAKIIRKMIPGTEIYKKYYYNIPIHICEENDSRNSGKPPYTDIKNNLYDNFWWINDSRTIKTRQLKYKLTFIKKCEDLENFDFFKYIKLPIGVGNIKEITIKSDTIEVVGNL
jgi:hypothetical protein